MTLSTSMRWLAKVETTWVFSLLIGMTNCVFTTRSATFRRIGSKMENKQFVPRRKKFA
jgi:hypothetical protein